MTAGARARRGMTRGGVVLAAVATAGCNAICNFAPCDSWAGATLQNACGYDVEVNYVAHGESSRSPETIPNGEVGEVGTTSSQIDVVVRTPGQWGWPITITWEEIQEQAPNQDDVFVLTGQYCPQ